MESSEKSRWQVIREEIDERRRDRAHDIQTVKNIVIRRLKRLADGRHCSPNAIGWLQHRRTGKATKIDLKRGDGSDSWGHAALVLRGMEHLEDGALLTVSIDIDERHREIVSYSISVVGARRPEPSTEERPAPRPFYIRVDLDDEPKGKGLCGHPLLHCHVGDLAGQSRAFSPRIPLPWLPPGDALDMILANVHPPLEP